MRFPTLALIAVVALAAVAQTQIFSGFVNNFRHMFHHGMHMFQRPSFFRGHHRPSHHRPSFFRGNQRPRGPKDLDETGGTKKPVSTGVDNPFPDDCGRDPKKGTGLLCFPDGQLCKERVNRVGNQRFGNHLYWMSWLSDEPQLRNANWDWFNARNYCRKRCMDLVSIETRQEYEWLKGFTNGVKYYWTSGRLCDFDGCDRGEFFPKHINGWFWSANQAKMSPTNSSTAFHDWSFTGGRGSRQPDNREGGESCMAVLNNFYGDGIKWHDVGCTHEKPIICEDVEGHLNFARQTFPNIRIP